MPASVPSPTIESILKLAPLPKQLALTPALVSVVGRQPSIVEDDETHTPTVICRPRAMHNVIPEDVATPPRVHK